MSMYNEHDLLERTERIHGHGMSMNAPSPAVSSCSSGGGGGAGPGGTGGSSANGLGPLSPHARADFSSSISSYSLSPSSLPPLGISSMSSENMNGNVSANAYTLSSQSQQIQSPSSSSTTSAVRSPDTVSISDRRATLGVGASVVGEVQHQAGPTHSRSPAHLTQQQQQQQQQRATKASHFAALFPAPRATASYTTTVNSSNPGANPLPTPAHSPRSAHSQSFAASHPHSSYHSGSSHQHHYHPYNYPHTAHAHASPHSTSAASTGTGSGAESLAASPLGLLPSLSLSYSHSHSSASSSAPTSVSAASRPSSSSDFCLTSPPASDTRSHHQQGQHVHQQHEHVESPNNNAEGAFAFDPRLGSELPLWPGHSAPPSKHAPPQYTPTGYVAGAVSATARARAGSVVSLNTHAEYAPYTFDDDGDAELDLVESSELRLPRAHYHHQDHPQPGEAYSPYTPYTPNPGGNNANGSGGYFDLLGLAQQTRERSASNANPGANATARTLLQPFSDRRSHQHPNLQYAAHENYTHHLAHPAMYNDTDFDGYDSDDILSGSNVPPGGVGAYPHAGPSARFSGQSDPTGLGSGGKKDDKQVRRRSSKACDQCRKSKCKCERANPNEPCKNCIMLGTACTFLGPSRKRGPPKGYIDAIESRLHQTEAVIGILLALAHPEGGEDSPKPDERALSLLEDLRNNDALAREIVDRVDRGAYGTRGRRNANGQQATGSAPGQPGSSGDERSGSGETAKGRSTSEKAADGAKPVPAGPPPSIQGRGRMVGLGQEIEMGGLFNTHPSNEWQDTVTERLKAAARGRVVSSSSTARRPSLSIHPPGVSDGVNGPASVGDGGPDERDRRRRRVDSVASSAHPHLGEDHSPERIRGSRVHRPSVSLSIGSDLLSPIVASGASAAHYSPPVAPQPSYAAASASSAPSGLAVGGLPQSAPSDGFAGQSSVNIGLEDGETGEDEEGITDAVGQLSLNEDAQVRFHGKVSGLHLLGQKPRMDGRNRGGIWHFPKARVWPPVAPATSIRFMRSLKEAEEVERAARARLPPRDVQEDLLDIYFAHVHPYLPIVQKETFYEDFRAMHEEESRSEKVENGKGAADRGRSPNVSKVHEADGERSTSPSQSAVTGAVDQSATESEASSPPPRIPALLLFSMFAIAARYAPIAHGTTMGSSASPPSIEAMHASLSANAHFEPVENGRTPSASGGDAESAEVSSSLSRIDAAEAEAEDSADVEADVAQPPPTAGHMWAAGDGFLDRAKAILDKTYSSSRPSTCQALLLMGYREIGIGAMAQSWLYVGMAVRMAQDLGMHRQSDRWSRVDGPIFTPVEQQIRKRIWYACVVMDKYVSTYIGRPLSIFETDYDTQLPGVDESEELELWAPHNSQPNTVMWDPVAAGAQPVPNYEPVPGRILSCFNESARLSSILAMIVQSIYAVRPVTSRHLEAFHLESTLDRWYHELPEHLRYDSNVKDAAVPPPHVLTLHMQYWCAVLLLHRPFIRHYIAIRQKQAASPDSPIEPDAYSAAQKNFDLCVSAANHITSIVSVYLEHFCIKRCSVFLSYYIFSAGIMHMTSMATTPSDPQASLGLNKCMDALKRMELVWPSAGRAWQLLDGAKDDLDFSSTFSPEVRPKKRSADESFDIANLEEAVSQLERATANRHPHEFSAPAPANGHAFGSATIDIDSPLAYFSSYDRWSADSTFGIPIGLSTSVLPQQFSTGFLDERLAHNIQRYGDVVNSNGRYSHIASDYSLGQTSSMLGSMYGMHPLSHSMSQLAGHTHPPNPQHPQAHIQGSSGIYLNDQYDIFNQAPQP